MWIDVGKRSFNVSVKEEKDEMVWVAHVNALGITSHGKTEEEAIAVTRKAIENFFDSPPKSEREFKNVISTSEC
jgi:predicted RNase H-like HicB family nuclease